MNRRSFLKTVAVAGAAGAVGIWRPSIATAQTAGDIEIVLHPKDAGATISPQIYGHFIEHLGGVIYDGIWVGTDSKIPNTGGIRQQFIDDMKAIGAPNFRWPGGCFADGYHWRDGIGPPAKRPRTYSYWQKNTPQEVKGIETNQFGTHEFMQLSRLTGAQPYVAGNVGSGTVEEFHDWVDYWNAPANTLTLADERAANGDRDPFNIQYWGIGNESWGCGGDMSPQEYAQKYRQFVTQFPMHTPPFLIGTGPRGHSADHDIGWTRGFFEAMQGGRHSRVDGFSLHYYTDFRQTKFKAGQFTPGQWYSVLLKGLVIEEAILQNWKIMGEFDPDHHTKFIVDEWGNWYPPGEELVPDFTLSQPITLRDAIHASLTFDVFNRHADKIAMANVAQTINCLHSLFLAHEEKFARTPVYYVFQMYRAHGGGKLVPIDIGGGEQTVTAEEGPAKMPLLYGSASVNDSRTITVTLTNPSLESSFNAQLRIEGARPTEASGQILTHEDRQAANTFAKPGEVSLAALQTTIDGQTVRVRIPKQSVVSLSLRIS
jgi:alpha-N-arabinofuranosidase